MKRIFLTYSFLLLTYGILFTGCAEQMAEAYAFNNGHPNSQKMFMDLTPDKELGTELSKYWTNTDYNKDGIVVIKEADIVKNVKLEYFSEKFYPAYEKSNFPKDYVKFAEKRGNTVKKYNHDISKHVFSDVNPDFWLKHFFQDTSMSTQKPIGNIFIEFNKEGKIISGLGAYYYRWGENNISVDCYHTYFTGEAAKKIERIITKKQLEDNLAF